MGKKTLIGKLLAGQLRDRFGLTGSVAAYGYSFRVLESIFDARADHVLHQWQDKTDALIEELRRRFPASTHRAIVIWRPWSEHIADFARIYGEQVEGVPTAEWLIDSWTQLVEPRFRHELPRLGVAVELVDGSTPDYRPLSWTDVDRLLVAGP